MDLNEITGWLGAKFQRDKDELEQFLGEHLPVLANFAQKAATNPLIASILRAEHISPEWFTALADVVDKADGALKVAADAKAAAEAVAAAATAVPADPAAQPVTA